jgi:hypothetical protein
MWRARPNGFLRGQQTRTQPAGARTGAWGGLWSGKNSTMILSVCPRRRRAAQTNALLPQTCAPHRTPHPHGVPAVLAQNRPLLNERSSTSVRLHRRDLRKNASRQRLRCASAPQDRAGSRARRVSLPLVRKAHPVRARNSAIPEALPGRHAASRVCRR